MSNVQRLVPVPFTKVKLQDGFWAPRQEINRTVTIPVAYEQSKQTGRIDAWKLNWKPGDPNPPHIFWDSDVAKWLEAVGYSLAVHPDAELEALADAVIDDIAAAQQEDGYLNVHFTVVEPEKRWTNLRDWHELYCAGHLMEAAVAYYTGTGKRTLLDVLCRYADHIGRVFGWGRGKKRGYPGHEEIELGLVKLYRATADTNHPGEKRYLDLAGYFVDERGRFPHYFDQEAQARGDTAAPWYRSHEYNQSHRPVREQTTAEGHAVRAMYLFSGMADVAAETGDETLIAACRRLWDNVTRRRMYITGGVGSSSSGERFTYDYDLPNELAYAETCAAIGLVLWAHRMLQLERDAAYADVMERALYNGVLSGVSLDGRRFFYGNPLTVDPKKFDHRPDLLHWPAVAPQRQEWFGCACCPPNVLRTLASLGQVVYSQTDTSHPGDEAAYVHLYVQGRGELEVGGHQVEIEQRTNYPWDGKIEIAVHPEQASTFTLALRLPGWCRQAALQVNGEGVAIEPLLAAGYIRVERRWAPGDGVVLDLAMPVERIEAHPAVHEDAGRVALQRGPLVYCLEEVDNGPHLADLALRRDTPLEAAWDGTLLGGVVTLTGRAQRRAADGWGEALYRPVEGGVQEVPFLAVPYYAWANREPGEMMVWIRART
ncbi:MAG: glycoside hydrolase family 127 protein [Anaerolineae bacterium]|nr:glycoside hydrolase family 127 protein [Anaerolineae bacterium]